MAQDRILVVDDKENMLKLFCRLLSDRYHIATAADGREGLKLFQEGEFDLVVADIRMPHMSGMQLLQECKRLRPDVVVILMTAYGEVSQAVEAIKQGAFDYITKPFDPDHMAIVIDRAIKHKALTDRASELQAQVEEQHGLNSIVGNSPAIRRCIELVHKTADSDTTMLITGESGTGKELFARAIHYTSKRRHFRFVPINCGAMPKDLIESELFGHVKGAFSGANVTKIGLLEEADQGTVLLDEIGELPLDVQVKINRAIQELEIRPVGDVRDKTINVRFVAATNADLNQAVDKGLFRKDLFYRLNVLVLAIPPLRDRLDDVPLLTEHFVAKYCKREGRDPLPIEPEAISMLGHYHWPGNVRELENILAVAVLMADEHGLTAELLRSAPIARILGRGDKPESPVIVHPSSDVAALGYKEAMELMNRECTRFYLTQLLDKFRGNVVQAASHAGVERGSFYRLMRKCGVKVEEHHQD